MKSGDELYDLGVDLVSRKDYGGAREKFAAALQKGTKHSAAATVYMRLIDLNGNRSSISSYEALRTALSQLSEPTIKFGVTNISVSDLDAECDLDVQEIKATQMPDDNYKAKGQALIEVAGGYASTIGDKPLILQEVFKGTTEATGTKESLILQAQAYEVMGKGCVYSDPKQGSEYLQMAYNFRRQIGDSGEEDLRLMKNFAVSAKCWICGRPVAGMGVHFMAVKSKITDMFRGAEDKESIKSSSENYGDIYICLPCYSAISNRSDQIARSYYEKCMEEMRAMEARMESEMAVMRTSIHFSR